MEPVCRSTCDSKYHTSTCNPHKNGSFFTQLQKKKSQLPQKHRSTFNGMAGHGRRPRTAGVVKRRAGHAQDHSIEHTSCFSLCTAQHVRVEKLFGSMHRCLQLLAAESEQLSARICRLKRAESRSEIASEITSESASESSQRPLRPLARQTRSTTCHSPAYKRGGSPYAYLSAEKGTLSCFPHKRPGPT